MKTETTDLSSYVPPGLRTPKIANIVFDECGEELIARLNEAFRGRRGIEDLAGYRPNQPLSFLNTPRQLYHNGTLRRVTNNRFHVVSAEQAIEGWDAIPELSDTYADTSDIVIFPGVGVNEKHRQHVLSLIGDRYRTAKVPLLVGGLTVEPSDSFDEGFAFKGTDYMDVREVEWMVRDQKVAYDPKKGVVPAEKGVQVWVPSSQSGLGGVDRDRDGLFAGWDGVGLLGADESGRVQVAQAPRARSA